jgi:beta-phosphoglucomutase family hydrolase
VNGLPDPIRAVLFDLDGVLTPTATVHAAAWAKMFDGFLWQRLGDGYTPFDPDADYNEYVDGKPRSAGARDFLASRGIQLAEGTSDDPPDADTIEGLAARKDQIFLDRVTREGVEPYPGSVRYLKAVRAAGMRTAVVSASRHCEIIVRAAGLEDLLDARVDGVVAASEGLNGKPAPDTFLDAARLLDTSADRAVVIEDATAGVTAGRAGHFGYVIGVNRIDKGTSHTHADALRANGADVVVRDLADLLTSAAT